MASTEQQGGSGARSTRTMDARRQRTRSRHDGVCTPRRRRRAEQSRASPRMPFPSRSPPRQSPQACEPETLGHRTGDRRRAPTIRRETKTWPPTCATALPAPLACLAGLSGIRRLAAVGPAASHCDIGSAAWLDAPRVERTDVMPPRCNQPHGASGALASIPRWCSTGGRTSAWGPRRHCVPRAARFCA